MVKYCATVALFQMVKVADEAELYELRTRGHQLEVCCPSLVLTLIEYMAKSCCHWVCPCGLEIFMASPDKEPAL